MDFKKFTGRIVLLSVVTLIILASVIFITGNHEYILPLIFGWGLSFSSVIAGSFIITKAMNTEGTGFINTVLLSMVVRMFITLALLFVLIYFFKIDKIGLAVVFFFYYLLFLIFEINFLSDKSKKTNSKFIQN